MVTALVSSCVETEKSCHVLLQVSTASVSYDLSTSSSTMISEP